ncbi:hypothetical protein F9278_18565 [Streptomyces phaeolivaceus]|uniref:Uncharacterized protein n=1 Tax=Streptomyces phaeolivaceus TaxID=2653200 RepID=A0A5P8K5R8_9ACTN|nr:hypothetical protein F9278_18565 [Streptomyces phaeolivaceus]
MTAGASEAQQLGQQQLQRRRAAPGDPAVRVEVSAKYASMPTRTAVHTSAVNFASGIWMPVHLFRCIRATKGLCVGCRGHMAHNPERVSRIAPERDRTPGRLSP